MPFLLIVRHPNERDEHKYPEDCCDDEELSSLEIVRSVINLFIRIPVEIEARANESTVSEIN